MAVPQIDLAGAATEVAALLIAAGVPAVVDVTDLEVPGAWVTPGDIEFPYLDGSADVTWDVYLIAPDTGTTDALGKLSAMLAKLDGFAIADTTALSLNLPNHGTDPLPALLCPIQTQVTKD